MSGPHALTEDLPVAPELPHATDAAARGGWPRLWGRVQTLLPTLVALALVPLREVRRALKAPAPPVDDRAREDLREDVKAAELRAERVLMETLADLAGAASGGAHALSALKAASQAWGKPAPDVDLAALAAALG